MKATKFFILIAIIAENAFTSSSQKEVKLEG
jgi:hypothetical protein